MTSRSWRAGRVVATLLGLMVVSPLFRHDGTAAPKFGDWSVPVNLGPVVNTEYGEFAAHVSKDGLSLYFASNRPASYGSFGGEDLWVSQRASQDGAWGSPVNLGGVVNTASIDRSPALSRDGHYLFFASDRTGGLGALDIWVAWRANTRDDFGWEAPVNLGAPVNSASTDAGPNFFENDDAGVPLLFLASNRTGGPGGLDIYVSPLAGGQFGQPALIPELNTPQLDLTPGVRHDGLEIVIASSRPGGAGSQDLWVATRASVSEPWSVPVNLGVPINSSAPENFPTISANRRALFFDSGRVGGFGGSDLFVSTREQ